MAQILRKGTLPEDITYDLVCRTCDTLARFKRSEGRDGTPNRQGTTITFTCPLCNKPIYIDEGNLSSYETGSTPESSPWYR